MSFVEQLAEFIGSSTEKQSFNEWWKLKEIKEAYLLLVKQYISKLKQPKSVGTGRGIVIPGGGKKYFPSVWVAVNRIRQVGCHLPIEVWHLGDLEYDPYMRSLLQPLGVTFRDALALRQKHEARILNGWELKPYSVLHSRFKEVLFMDADCAPVKSPEYLFNTEGYSRTGAVFFPDYPHWTLQENIYTIFGAKAPDNCPHIPDDTPYFGKPIDLNQVSCPPWESGQFLVDKSRRCKEIELAMFYCGHSDYFFKQIHGDKDCFNMAAITLANGKIFDNYSMPMYWPGWDTHTIRQYDFDGSVIFEHRSGADMDRSHKWKLADNVKGAGKLLGEAACLKLVDELAKVWKGTIWENYKPNDGEKKVMMEIEKKRNFFYYRHEQDARLLELLPKGKIGNGADVCERRWSVFTHGKGYRLIILGEDRATCFLQMGDDSIWRGRWQEYEKMPVALVPVDIAGLKSSTKAA